MVKTLLLTIFIFFKGYNSSSFSHLLAGLLAILFCNSVMNVLISFFCAKAKDSSPKKDATSKLSSTAWTKSLVKPEVLPMRSAQTPRP